MNDSIELIKFVLINIKEKKALTAEMVKEEFIELLNRLQEVYELCITENKVDEKYEVIVLNNNRRLCL